jgi:hypothetical protein
MIYVKAAAVGIITALLLAVLWVMAALWLPIYWEMFRAYLRNDGGAAANSMVGSGSALLAALIGFAAGFYVTVRRSRRRQLAS